jgi:predicted DNA-binding transcriptional regulator YafY
VTSMKKIDRTKSQLLRVMELDREIRSGKYPNCLTFSVDWEVSQKTIQRDIDYLRDQHGAPIEYDRDKKGFYYTDPSWFLPAVALSEGELLSLLMGTEALRALRGTPMAAQLETMYGKLAQMLPENISVAPEILFNEFSVVSTPARPIELTVWKAVVRGLTHRCRIKIKYQRFGSKSVREMTVDPYHLTNLQGEWYLFAGKDGHDGWRQYSLGRIRGAEVTNTAFDIPDSFHPEKVVRGSFGRARMGKAVTVRLLFNAEVRDWVLEREWHPAQKLKQRKDGSVELSFPAHGLFEVQRWVLSWGRQVRVLAPKELAAAVRDEIDAMASLLKR